jgi:hypothetical protein
MDLRPDLQAAEAATNGADPVGDFCDVTAERASGLAGEKVAEAATRLEADLHTGLGVDSDELRAEGALGERVMLAEAAVRERIEWAVAEAREEVGGSVEERLRDEVERLRAALAAPDGHANGRPSHSLEVAREEARRRALYFRSEVKARLKSGLEDAEERLRATVRARLLAARSEISAENRRDPGEVGALAARLLTRSATRLDGGGQPAADELGARIEIWMDEVRARTDAAERRLDEAGARARGRLEEYVDVSLSRKARRHELRLARAERKERIAEAEARVEARGEEMLRQVRVDVDRVRAEAQASMRTELGAAIERMSELFESETEAFRFGMEGELERMLRAARKQLTSGV